MGCINTNQKIKVKSIKSFKEEIKRKLKQEIREDLSNKIFSFSDFVVDDDEVSKSSNEYSQILIDAQIKNNELIFL